MKNKYRWLIWGSALVWVSLYTASSALAQANQSPLKVGKNGEVTFTNETKVGDITLPPGRYKLQHRVDGTEHFLHFTALSAVNPYYRSRPTVVKGHPGETKCRLELVGKKVGRTTILTTKENGADRIAKVEIDGENVAHMF